MTKASDSTQQTLSDAVPGSYRGRALRRDGYSCRHCGCEDELHVHHIVPEREGGPDALHNLVTLCATHHRKVHRIGPNGDGEYPPSLAKRVASDHELVVLWLCSGRTNPHYIKRIFQWSDHLKERSKGGVVGLVDRLTERGYIQKIARSTYETTDRGERVLEECDSECLNLVKPITRY